MKIYKNKYGSFRTICRNKLMNGEEIKCYLPVQFRKGTEPEEECVDIEPSKWWFSAYMNKDGETKPKLFIMEYERIMTDLEEVYEKKEKKDETRIYLDDVSDLKFY